VEIQRSAQSLPPAGSGFEVANQSAQAQIAWIGHLLTITIRSHELLAERAAALLEGEVCTAMGRPLTARSQPLTIQISGHVDHDAVWENNPQSGAAGVECLGGRCCTVFPIVAPYLNGKKRQSCTPQSA
jgi:hypothetical protein